MVIEVHGEVELLNEYDEHIYCSPEKHKANSRVEIKFIGFSDTVEDFKILAQI